MSTTSTLHTPTEQSMHDKSHSLLDKTRAQPPEILEAIFMYVCNGAVVIPSSSHGYPWILGHVCSRWRQVLWSSPLTWKAIIVIPNRRKEYLSPASYPVMLRNILENILLKITIPISLTVLGLESFIHLEPTVRNHHDRFSAFVLSEISPKSLCGLLYASPGTFSALETLSVSIGHGYNREPFPHIDNVTSLAMKAPNLRSVTYKMGQFSCVPSLFVLPWAKMEEIHVEGMALPPQTVYDIWRSAPALVSCAFKIADAQTIHVPHEVSVRALKTLELTAPDHEMDHFFGPITVPVLESLELETRRMPMHALAALVARSGCGCSLRVLRLRQRGDDDDGRSEVPDFALLLDQLPRVETLAVSWCIPPSIVQRIRDGDFPNLASATFSVLPAGFEAFLDILDSYVDGTCPPERKFRYFDVMCYRGPGFVEREQRYLARYQSYQAIEGLSVRVFDGTTGSWMGLVSGIQL